MSRILAVQSFCFRGFKDNAKVIELVKAIGLSHIELCGIHVKFDEPETFDGVIEQYKKAGIGIVSIGVERIGVDEAHARRRFEFCRKAGIKNMTTNFMPEEVPQSLRLAEKLAAEYGMKLGIHNHGGYHWLGSIQMLRHTFNVTQPSIGLWLDTAWALAAGEDPIKFIEMAGERLYGVHIKDFVFEPTGKPRDVVSGKGNLNLPKLKEALDAVKFTGPLVIEYEADVNDPAPALTQCVKAVRAAM